MEFQIGLIRGPIHTLAMQTFNPAAQCQGPVSVQPSLHSPPTPDEATSFVSPWFTQLYALLHLSFIQHQAWHVKVVGANYHMNGYMDHDLEIGHVWDGKSIMYI